MLFRGIDNTAVRERPRTPAPYLTADTASAISATLRDQCRQHTLQQQHALAAVLFGFLFTQRADTTVHIQLRDIVITDAHFVFNETTRKSKVVASVREVLLPMNNLHAHSLCVYIKWVKSRGMSPEDNLFAFPPDVRLKSSSLMDDSIKSALSAAKQTHHHVSSHMLRRGSAISMLACGVPRDRICDWGAWYSTNGIEPYLKGRTFIIPSEFDRSFFQWMC